MKTTNFSSPIICGTDFSDNAKRAADVAAALATRLNAPLLLVHASVIPGSLYTEDHLDAEAQRLHSTAAELSAEVVEGNADEVLIELAQQRQARLLVVSSIGRQGPQRWLLGSVAERVAETAQVPTLVVRDAAPFEAWASGERPLKVFVGTDFGASSDAALRWVAELREIGPVEVVASYVDWPPEEATRLGISGLRALSENPPGMQCMLERDVRNKVTQVLGEENVSIRVVGNWGRAEFPLMEMAIEAQADLIVVGTHQRHGLDRLHYGSFSRGILHHAPMSVACVPTSAGALTAGPRIRACQRVLVAVDLNEAHGFAAPYGYSIVNPGSTVRLLHNIVPPRALHREDEKDSNKLFAACEAKLRALAPEEADAPDITTEVEVTENRETAEAICAAAERFDADIICIGSHTRPGFTAKILGSVALAVMQTSRRPVLVVWPPTK